MMRSFYMHETACQHLLHQGSRQYKFSTNVTKKLVEVDRLTLRLHLELSFNYQRVPLR